VPWIHPRPPGYNGTSSFPEEEFHAGRFTEGLVAVVRRVGDELVRHFPRRPGEIDENELPDVISRG
jgi:hypothetical protein